MDGKCELWIECVVNVSHDGKLRAHLHWYGRRKESTGTQIQLTGDYCGSELKLTSMQGVQALHALPWPRESKFTLVQLHPRKWKCISSFPSPPTTHQQKCMHMMTVTMIAMMTMTTSMPVTMTITTTMMIMTFHHMMDGWMWLDLIWWSDLIRSGQISNLMRSDLMTSDLISDHIRYLIRWDGVGLDLMRLNQTWCDLIC